MTSRNTLSMRPQPMIAVADVEKSSRWYQQILGAHSGHGGAEYEQLIVDGQLIMQLHRVRDPDGYAVVLAEPHDSVTHK